MDDCVVCVLITSNLGQSPTNLLYSLLLFAVRTSNDSLSLFELAGAPYVSWEHKEHLILLMALLSTRSFFLDVFPLFLPFFLIFHDLSLPFLTLFAFLLHSSCFGLSSSHWLLLLLISVSSSPPLHLPLLSSFSHQFSMPFPHFHRHLLPSFVWSQMIPDLRNPPSLFVAVADAAYGASVFILSCSCCTYGSFALFLEHFLAVPVSFCDMKNRCSCLNAVRRGRVRIVLRLIYSKRTAIVLLIHTSKPQWDRLLYKHSNMEPLGL